MKRDCGEPNANASSRHIQFEVLVVEASIPGTQSHFSLAQKFNNWPGDQWKDRDLTFWHFLGNSPFSVFGVDNITVLSWMRHSTYLFTTCIQWVIACRGLSNGHYLSPTSRVEVAINSVMVLWTQMNPMLTAQTSELDKKMKGCESENKRPALTWVFQEPMFLSFLSSCMNLTWLWSNLRTFLRNTWLLLRI